MTAFLKLFERCIVLNLLFLMMLTLLVSTIELAVVLYEQLMAPPFLLLNLPEMLEVFGFFLMVLIGLELLETIKGYLEQDKVHVEIVFLVAMVAMSRKAVIMDYKDTEPPVMYGMALIILALSVGYFLVKQALGRDQAQGNRADSKVDPQSGSGSGRTD